MALYHSGGREVLVVGLGGGGVGRSTNKPSSQKRVRFVPFFSCGVQTTQRHLFGEHCGHAPSLDVCECANVDAATAVTADSAVLPYLCGISTDTEARGCHAHGALWLSCTGGTKAKTQTMRRNLLVGILIRFLPIESARGI